MALIRARDLELTPRERAVLMRPASPQALQAYINAIPINHELAGDTCYTVRQVLRHRRARCIEAALLAACVLWLHGEPPLIMDMRARGDWDHVVALFRLRRSVGGDREEQPRRAARA